MRTVLQHESEQIELYPLNGETWIICGGRDFDNQEMFDGAMRDVVALKGLPDRVVHGAQTGADTMADKWGRRMGLDVKSIKAEWTRLGGAAGPIRNQQMIDEFKPHRVVAFPGGPGTRNMMNKARAANIEVIEIVAGALPPTQSTT